MIQDRYLYFVQKFDPCLCDSNGEIVALMPEVCYELDKKAVKYKVFGDFHDFHNRKGYSLGYSKRLSEWMDSFDRYIRSNIDDPLIKKLAFVRLYASHLNNLTESVLNCCKNIESILNEMKPSEVHLIIEESATNYEVERRLWSKKQELCYLLLPLICKAKNIQYSVKFVSSDEVTKKANIINVRIFIGSIVRKGKNVLKKIRDFFIHKIFFFRNKGLKVILLHDDGWLGNIQMELIRSGWNIYPSIVYDNQLIINFTNSHIKQKWEKIFQKCMEQFVPSKWINEESGIDLSSIFNERFEFFFTKVCPFIEQEVNKYKKIIKNNNIKYVVCPYKIHPTDFAIMAVATIMEEVCSVQVEHGGGEIFYRLWSYSEQPANLYISSSKEEVECFDMLFNHENKMDTKVVPGVVWIQRYKKKSEIIKKKLLNKEVPRKIYYLPSCQGIQRFNSSYPLSWYYCFQRDLIKYFSELKDFDFVVKTSPSVPWLSDPIKQLIEDNKFSNIFCKDGDLVKSLMSADKVITDYPSSPTYEARLLGLPILSLYHEQIDVRETAKKKFKKTLVSYVDCESACKIIKSFLAAPDEEYIVSMDDEFDSIHFIDLINGMQENNKDLCGD